MLEIRTEMAAEINSEIAPEMQEITLLPLAQVILHRVLHQLQKLSLVLHQLQKLSLATLNRRDLRQNIIILITQNIWKKLNRQSFSIKTIEMT